VQTGAPETSIEAWQITAGALACKARGPWPLLLWAHAKTDLLAAGTRAPRYCPLPAPAPPKDIHLAPGSPINLAADAVVPGAVQGLEAPFTQQPAAGLGPRPLLHNPHPAGPARHRRAHRLLEGARSPGSRSKLAPGTPRRARPSACGRRARGRAPPAFPPPPAFTAASPEVAHDAVAVAVHGRALAHPRLVRRARARAAAAVAGHG
jgi:hypothetical protein